MKTLANQVGAKLEKRAFCVVFENDVERCWPSNKMTRTKRKEEIQSFAESQGWNATVLEGAFGIRVVFREGLEPDAISYEGVGPVPT
jgi:hypothetical protein